MKIYLIVEVDSYGAEYPPAICFASKDKAYNFCSKNNDPTYDYIQSCYDNYERPGNYTLLEVREIEVEE